MTTIPFLRFLRCGLCFSVLRYIDIDYVLRLINTITIRALFVLLGYFFKGLFAMKGFGFQHTSENTSSARFYKKNGRFNVHHKTNYSKTTAHYHKLSRSIGKEKYSMTYRMTYGTMTGQMTYRMTCGYMSWRCQHDIYCTFDMSCCLL